MKLIKMKNSDDTIYIATVNDAPALALAGE